MTEINLTPDATTKIIVANIRSTVRSASAYSAYVTAHGVTRENVAAHAAALAGLAYPNDKPVQKVDGKRTRYGNAVQAAAAGLRKVLAPVTPTDTERDYLAAILKSVDTGVTKGLDAATIAQAVADHIDGLLS